MRVRADVRQGGQAGWLTTSVSRPAALGRLDAALVEQPERFMSRRLLGECRSFVRLANGGTGARAGTHDDRVMAMAIGLGARAEMLGQASLGGIGNGNVSSEPAEVARTPGLRV